ncbi:MAG: nucleotidyl transferase AbiEii/AbiGii toxin family protein [Sulfurimonadaceae bacterium]
MTSNVMNALDKIKDLPLFKEELYFTGGTALSYYINHRISEDIDIISAKELEYKKIIASMLSIDAKKIEDENVFALRLAGLFPDEYVLKFILDGVKIEFFYANRATQKEILKTSSFKYYKGANLKILDVKTISKLKIVALLQREKSRDLFDFGAMLEHLVVSVEEILSVAEGLKNIKSKEELLKFIEAKEEAKEDEAVYLDEANRLDLSFEEIKKRVVLQLKV